MKPILEAKNLCFANKITYPPISIMPHEATFISGPSGCGKSSLLRLFNKTLSPSIGKLFYDGKEYADLDSLKLRQEVLLIGQSVYLFDGTIYENFQKYYEYRELPLPEKGVIEENLALCGADFQLDKHCGNMSGGERQRVYIAIFLSFTSRVLLLDEPTSALDLKTAELILQNIKTHCKVHNMTMVIVSHDEALREQFADYRISLENIKT